MIGGIGSYGYAAYQGLWIPGSSYAVRSVSAIGGAVKAVAVPAAQPGQPVEPVGPVKPVQQVSDETPINRADMLLRLETDPAAARLRGQIQYPVNFPGQSGEGAADLPGNGVSAAQTGGPQFGDPRIVDASGLLRGEFPALPGTEQSGASYEIESPQETVMEGECQTCKNRKYQDGSDDPGVSFKTPSHIDPDTAGSVVRSHENEHVTRERAKASRENREVVSQSVTYRTEICPECGKVYVSGGTTRTVTASRGESRPDAGAEQEKN